MSEPTTTRIYVGAMASVAIALPDRTVRAERSTPVQFTADEAEILPAAEWVDPCVIDQEPAYETVPTGKVAAVLAWVGSDPARAALALAAETADTGGHRSSLVAKLTSLVPTTTSATGANTEEG